MRPSNEGRHGPFFDEGGETISAFAMGNGLRSDPVLHLSPEESPHEPIASVEEDAVKSGVEKLPEAPHGWPSPRRFPQWYWRRLSGFDQSLNQFGYFLSWDLLVAGVFTCITLVVLGLIEEYAFYPLVNHSIGAFIPAFGSTCAVVYGTPKDAAAQPRSVIFAHVSGALIGAALSNAFQSVSIQPFGVECAGALGVALHLALMQITNLMHPPASATVVSTATATFNVYYKDRGFLFVIAPVMFGSIVTLVIAWLLNNLIPSHSPYPQYW